MNTHLPVTLAPRRPARAVRPLAGLLMAGPGLVWLLGFVLFPIGLIVGVSLLTPGEAAGFGLPLTGRNYRRLCGFGELGFEPLYPQIILRSLALGLTTALACLVVGLPLAFWIGSLRAGFRTLALMLVVIPFWTNLLIRTYAWQILLAPDGWITQLVRAAGLGTAGQGLYPSAAAVIICMVCDYLPFMVLPLYASVEKIDWTLAEAAADLGADSVRVFHHALLPQVKSGLIAGGVLVFLPATGQFVIPDLLGGAKTVLLGNALQQQFGPSLDWPFGSAIAVLGLGVVLIGMGIQRRRLEWL